MKNICPITKNWTICMFQVMKCDIELYLILILLLLKLLIFLFYLICNQLVKYKMWDSFLSM